MEQPRSHPLPHPHPLTSSSSHKPPLHVHFSEPPVTKPQKSKPNSVSVSTLASPSPSPHVMPTVPITQNFLPQVTNAPAISFSQASQPLPPPKLQQPQIQPKIQPQPNVQYNTQPTITNYNTTSIYNQQDMQQKRFEQQFHSQLSKSQLQFQSPSISNTDKNNKLNNNAVTPLHQPSKPADLPRKISPSDASILNTSSLSITPSPSPSPSPSLFSASLSAPFPLTSPSPSLRQPFQHSQIQASNSQLISRPIPSQLKVEFSIADLEHENTSSEQSNLAGKLSSS